MIVVKTRQALEKRLISKNRKTLSPGFIPTMGALHEGHLSLIRHSLAQDPVTVVSIFVNPTQFNDPKDLKEYPRNPEADQTILRKILRPEDLVFMPDVNEIYPVPDQRIFHLGHLDKVMEGKFRPGHFNGVAQVVSRLFEIVKPYRAYFGLKDFQQLAVIKKVVYHLNMPVQIIPCPIVREPDGLAMSSRNVRLGTKERDQAPRIFQTLSQAVLLKTEYTVDTLKKWVIRTIEEAPLLRVEYFEIVHEDTLLPVNSWDEPGEKQGCIAVWAGEIRLIDNISF